MLRDRNVRRFGWSFGECPVVPTVRIHHDVEDMQREIRVQTRPREHHDRYERIQQADRPVPDVLPDQQQHAQQSGDETGGFEPVLHPVVGSEVFHTHTS